MANPERGEVVHVVDGRRLVFRLSMNACRALQGVVGADDRPNAWIETLVKAQKRDLEAILVAVWSSLEIPRSYLTAEALGAVLSPVDAIAIFDALDGRARPDPRDVEALGTGKKKSSGGDRPWDWRALEIEAGRVGLTGARFWRLTLRELYRAFVIASIRAKDDLRREAHVAFRRLALERSKSPAQLYRSWVDERPAPRSVTRASSPEEHVAMLESLAAQYGGFVTEDTPADPSSNGHGE